MASCHLVVLAGLLLATQLHLDTVLVGAQNTNFSFPYFNTTDSFLTVGDVMHDIQTSSFTLTPEGAALFQGSCGKLFYKDPVRMKASPSGVDVASFRTAFTFNIHGPNIIGSPFGWQHADGVTFTFCRYSNLNQFNDATGFGGSYCLLNHQYDGMPSNRLFAVEFDIFQDSDVNDISDNHIGININSMKSSWYYNLCGGSLRNCTYLCNGGYFTSWIDYDNATQMLQVFLANGSLTTSIPKPPRPLINVSLALAIPLGELVDDYMYVGFTAGTGVVGALHQIQSWTFQSSGMPELDFVSHHGRSGTIAGALSAGAVAALLLVGFFFIARFRKQDMFNLADQNQQLVPREFTYEELRKATKNFSKSEFLGCGGFGKVYKGTLPSGVQVAVKRLKHGTRDLSFQAEIHSLTQIGRHRNLVQLKGWGWYHEKEQLFLVFDYMSNGSLDEWLFGHSKRRGRSRKWYSSNLSQDETTLPLNLRYSVLRGVAAALLYLHEECSQCVLHRDIKSSNVLLDGFWTAHLGDFGLARVITHRGNMGKTEKTTEGGTFGYMAPEVPIMGKATKESDVYSFGVLMLEVMCGTRPLDIPEGDHGTLVDKVWHAQEGGNILQVADSRLGTFPPSDPAPGLGGEFRLQDASRISNQARDADKRLITNLLHLGLLCCNPNPEDRPVIGAVSQWLQSAETMETTSLPALPICKPHAHYAEGAHNRV